MKRNNWYFIGLIPAMLCIAGNLLGGWWTATNFVYSLIVLGLLDLALGEDSSNESDDSSLPSIWLLLHTLAHAMALFSLFWGIYTKVITEDFVIWSALSVGFQSGSSAVVVAHECIHKKFRLRKLGPLFRVLQNIQIQNYAWFVAILGVLFFLNSLLAWAWLIVIGMAAILLEYVNYIEHYGLLRENGEPVGVEHSWNTQRRVSRFLLLDLPRHSHHHMHANLPYHQLESLPKERILPGGYASLIFPVFIPIWWFLMIHPKLNSN